jgi:glycosyltransferase involved in cell wall biosynthesis
MPEPKPNPTRILISGFEIGGQMQLLAETMRKRWHQATASAYNDDFRGYQCDVMVGQQGGRLRRELDKFLFFLWAAHHYDVFHFFWGISLWSVSRFHHLDLPFLKLLGKKVVVHYRGLDVVDIAYFDWLRESARGTATPKPPMSRPEQQRRMKKWLKYADVVLVSEPDLHEVVPNAVLSPQVIDMAYWQPTRQPQSVQDGIIRIVHAPSSRRKKGTDFIEKSIAELKTKGLAVELVLAENLPHHKIKELYELSDIGLDQVLYGWHGKVSVELMALGRPVVCYIGPEYRKYRPDLPIVSAGPADLTEVLEDLVRDATKRAELGQRSREYVQKYHNVEEVVDQLFSLYGIEQRSLVKATAEGAKTW